MLGVAKIRQLGTICARVVISPFISIIEKNSKKSKISVYFDTSLKSYNLGDNIISRYCKSIVDEYTNSNMVVAVPTHVKPSREMQSYIIKADQKFLFGTNIVSNHLETSNMWKMPFSLYGYHDIIAVGVGSGQHLSAHSKYTSFMYKKILSKKVLHAVRDRYTEELFHKMGIHNVLYTGCVTLWGLTPEHCRDIPTDKAKNVITTITDYDRNPEKDYAMLQILKKNYETVYFWVQGIDDLKYLSTLIDISSVEIIEHTLDAYDNLLEKADIDYIGTRLHAGIHALNHKVRSLIIAIDNRATDMALETNLPILQRETEIDKIESWIYSRATTMINLPEENISRWKNQFNIHE